MLNRVAVLHSATAVADDELPASDRSDGAAEHRLRQSWRDPSRSSDNARHFRVDAVVSPEVLRTLPKATPSAPTAACPRSHRPDGASIRSTAARASPSRPRRARRQRKACARLPPACGRRLARAPEASLHSLAVWMGASIGAASSSRARRRGGIRAEHVQAGEPPSAWGRVHRERPRVASTADRFGAVRAVTPPNPRRSKRGTSSGASPARKGADKQYPYGSGRKMATGHCSPGGGGWA